MLRDGNDCLTTSNVKLSVALKEGTVSYWKTYDFTLCISTIQSLTTAFKISNYPIYYAERFQMAWLNVGYSTTANTNTLLRTYRALLRKRCNQKNPHVAMCRFSYYALILSPRFSYQRRTKVYSWRSLLVLSNHLGRSDNFLVSLKT